MRRLAVLALLAGCLSSRGGGGEVASCPQGRSVELGLQEEVQRLAGCTQVTGLVIRTGAPIDVSPLAELAEITGDLSIGPTIGLDEAAFNGLARVGGTIRVVTNGSLRGLYFPRLQQVGRIEIENNAVLTTISLPRLQTVDGTLLIAENDSLELLSAPMLATVGKELVISGHSKLNLLEMSRLSSVEAVRIEGNPKLPTEIAERLASKSSIETPSIP